MLRHARAVYHGKDTRRRALATLKSHGDTKDEQRKAPQPKLGALLESDNPDCMGNQGARGTVPIRCCLGNDAGGEEIRRGGTGAQRVWANEYPGYAPEALEQLLIFT